MGKTVLARALAASIEGKFTRLQCTPDLLPSDILGTGVFLPRPVTSSFGPAPSSPTSCWLTVSYTHLPLPTSDLV